MTKPQEPARKQLADIKEIGIQMKVDRSTSGPDLDINTNPDPIDPSVDDPYFEIASDPNASLYRNLIEEK